MESDKAQEFFDAGLQNYGKAFLAINEFKEMLEAELQNVMLAQPEGSTLKLAGEPGFTNSKGVPPYAYYSVGGTLAQRVSDSKGVVANPGRLDVVVWWTPPVPCETAAAVYAGVLGVPWAKQIVKPDGFDGGLYRGNSANYLTHDLVKQKTLSTMVRELLGHLDTACKKQQAALMMVGASENR